MCSFVWCGEAVENSILIFDYKNMHTIIKLLACTPCTLFKEVSVTFNTSLNMKKLVSHYITKYEEQPSINNVLYDCMYIIHTNSTLIIIVCNV